MSAARTQAILWMVQRATAALLAVFVVIHIVTLIHAVRAGLDASSLLARVHASIAWPAFYGAFAVVAALHAAIGLRTVAAEWLSWRGASADATVALLGLALAAAGLRAVVAVGS
jgi:fumarate reductase subunit C